MSSNSTKPVDYFFMLSWYPSVEVDISGETVCLSNRFSCLITPLQLITRPLLWQQRHPHTCMMNTTTTTTRTAYLNHGLGPLTSIPEEAECAICVDECTEPVELRGCKHTFCKCLWRGISRVRKCRADRRVQVVAVLSSGYPFAAEIHAPSAELFYSCSMMLTADPLASIA